MNQIPDDCDQSEPHGSGNGLASKGWIKMHRHLIEHPRYRDSEWVHLWLHLQLCATHKGRPALFAGKTIELKPGQLITGRFSLADATGVHPSKVKRILAQLKTDHLIDQQASNKNSLITILDWVTTQKSDQQNGHLTTNSRPTSDQQVTTNNNVKNGKNGKRERVAHTLKEVKSMAVKIGLSEPDAQIFFNYYSARGWLMGKTPMRELRPAMANWKLRGEDNEKRAQRPPPRPANAEGGLTKESFLRRIKIANR